MKEQRVRIYVGSAFTDRGPVIYETMWSKREPDPVSKTVIDDCIQEGAVICCADLENLKPHVFGEAISHMEITQKEFDAMCDDRDIEQLADFLRHKMHWMLESQQNLYNKELKAHRKSEKLTKDDNEPAT